MRRTVARGCAGIAFLHAEQIRADNEDHQESWIKDLTDLKRRPAEFWFTTRFHTKTDWIFFYPPRNFDLIKRAWLQSDWCGVVWMFGRINVALRFAQNKIRSRCLVRALRRDAGGWDGPDYLFHHRLFDFAWNVAVNQRRSFPIVTC